jgi:hypothetical protein
MDKEFISHIQEINSKDKFGSIDVLYEYIDNILDLKDFKRIEEIIELFIKSTISVNLYIAFLTITFTNKKNISNRKELYKKAELELIKLNITEKQIRSILKGLI